MDQYGSLLTKAIHESLGGVGICANAMGGTFASSEARYSLDPPIAKVNAGIYWKYAGPRRHRVLIVPTDGVARGGMDMAVYRDLQDFGAVGPL